MDKSMYNMKAEKIQKQVKLGDYETAAKICETIDWTQVRSARMLSLVSSVYEHVGKYDEAIDILLMAYEETPAGRRLLYKLTELAIAAGAIEDAEEWYNDYLDEAPDDNARYILRYKLAVAKDESIDKKIASLEAFRRQEMDEKWGYELAKLYDEAGDSANCVSLCDEIALYFGTGKYVDQAKLLRSKYSGEQVEIENEVPEVSIASDAESGQQISALDMSVFLPEDAEVQEEEETDEADDFGSTKRVSAKDDFSKTRIFTKLPANTAELKIFNTVTSASIEQPSEVETEQAAEEAAAPEAEPTQMSLDFNAGADANVAEEEPAQAETEVEAEPEVEEVREPIEVEHIIYVGSDTPQEAMNKAVEEIKNAHFNECTEAAQITKISAAKLNSKGIINSLIPLVGKDLIILGASGLDDGILSELKKASEELDKKKFFVLADSVERIKTVKERYESQGIEEEVVNSLANAVSEIELEEAVESLNEEPEEEEVIVPEVSVEEEAEAPIEIEIPAEPVVEVPAEPETLAEEIPAEEIEAEAEPEIDDDIKIYIPEEATELETNTPEEMDEEARIEAEIQEEMANEVPGKTQTFKPITDEQLAAKSEVEEPAAEEPAVEEEAEVEVEEIAAEPATPAEPEVEELAVEEPATPAEPELEELAIDEPDTPAEPVAEEPATEPEAEQPAEAEEPEQAEEPATEEASTEEKPHTEAILKRKIDHLDARKIMEPNEFLEYIKNYMKSIDCVLGEGTEDDLLIYIKELAADGERLNSILAEEMVETAADEAEGHSLGNFFRSRYDDNGNLILRAKHFI